MHSRALAAFAALAGILVVAVLQTASAHHGGAIEWTAEQRGPVTGTVSEFAFRFPHVQIFVDVPDEHGVATPWTLVTRWTPTILRRHGWSRDSLKPGDRVTFTYLPHRESPTTGSIESIEVNGTPLPLNFD